MAKKRQSWLDANSETTLIDDYARKLKGFADALADGVVQKQEVADQEARLVALMKEIEPTLDDQQHAQITKLLCELTAYNMLEVLNGLHESQAATAKSRWRP